MNVKFHGNGMLRFKDIVKITPKNVPNVRILRTILPYGCFSFATYNDVGRTNLFNDIIFFKEDVFSP